MKKPPRIYLARHCKTQWNLENRVQGTKDVPLSDEGRVEAQANISKIQNLGIDRVVSSNLTRAHETARIYADQLAVTLLISPELRELDLGHWEGKTSDELLNDPTCLYRQWLEDPASVSVPGSSESVIVAQRRIVEAMKDIAFRYRDEKVLVIAHKFIRAVLQCALLDVDLGHFRKHIDESTDPMKVPIEQIQQICEMKNQ